MSCDDRINRMEQFEIRCRAEGAAVARRQIRRALKPALEAARTAIALIGWDGGGASVAAHSALDTILAATRAPKRGKAGRAK